MSPTSLLIVDAAAILGVSRRTVYYRIRNGQLKTVRTGGGSQRVLMNSIESLLHNQRRKKAAPVVSALEPEALALQIEALP